MNVVKLVSIAMVFLSWANLAPAQPPTGPAVVLENKEKPKKDSPYRIIQGIVKDKPIIRSPAQSYNSRTPEHQRW